MGHPSSYPFWNCYFVKLFVTLATELANLELVYEKNFRSMYLFKPAPQALLWGGGITNTC
jgi:hypothetical protein